jgi:hypothetical protein
LNVEVKNFIIRNFLFDIRYSFLSRTSFLSDGPLYGEGINIIV